MAGTATYELWIPTGSVSPGDVIEGHVGGGPPEVRLIRYEYSPPGTVPVVIDITEPAADGSFAVTLPENAAPTLEGTQCSLAYAVRAGKTRRKQTDPHVPLDVVAPLERVASVEAHPLIDRMISRFDAKHFHVELSHADVQGGGSVAGRVHLDKGGAPPMIKVRARCEEVWRLDRHSLNLNRPPMWHFERLWEEEAEIEWIEGQRWMPFSFDIPASLPPAVEASSIAWRYEVEVARPTRFAMHERAVATPIGFDLT
jgi:hypothetical protein